MTKRLTDDELTQIRERADKATGGPWEIANTADIFTELGAENKEGILADDADGWHIADCSTGVTFVDGELEELSYNEVRSNASFIAYAREDIPKLLAEIERLGKENEHMKWGLSKIANSESEEDALQLVEDARFCIMELSFIRGVN